MYLKETRPCTSTLCTSLFCSYSFLRSAVASLCMRFHQNIHDERFQSGVWTRILGSVYDNFQTRCCYHSQLWLYLLGPNKLGTGNLRLQLKQVKLCVIIKNFIIA